MIHDEDILPQGDKMKSVTVKGRSKNSSRNITRNFNENTTIKSIVYDIDFPDGAVKQYDANTITENMYNQVDQHGRS